MALAKRASIAGISLPFLLCPSSVPALVLMFPRSLFALGAKCCGLLLASGRAGYFGFVFVYQQCRQRKLAEDTQTGHAVWPGLCTAPAPQGAPLPPRFSRGAASSRARCFGTEGAAPAPCATQTRSPENERFGYSHPGDLLQSHRQPQVSWDSTRACGAAMSRAWCLRLCGACWGEATVVATPSAAGRLCSSSITATLTSEH